MAHVRALGSRVWAGYNDALTKRPLLTKSLTSFTGFILGDALAQLPGREPYNWKRTARFALFGLAIHAPTSHLWYKVLDKNLYPRAATSARAIVTKTALDQLAWTPVQLVIFYSYLKTMEGRPEKIPDTLRDKFVPTLTTGWLLWPIAHLINFRYIPSAQRVLYINVVQVGWNVILCRLASKEPPSETAIELEKTEMPVPA